jgi:putative addiction module killer protein
LQGTATPFSDWLAALQDSRTVGVVRSRLNRIRLGNLGGCKSAGGGVEELRIDFGPVPTGFDAYRIEGRRRFRVIPASRP